jgi:formate C-acetyltransferase
MSNMTANPTVVEEQGKFAWRGFPPGFWQKAVDVRKFIQLNYTPY